MTKKILLIVSLLFVSIAYSQEKWTLKKCVEYALENNISVVQPQTLRLAEAQQELIDFGADLMVVVA